jgi:hypothetical protein
MDFYKFVANVMSAERIVTQIYPMTIVEFEKRFNTNVKKSYIDIQYNYQLSRFDVKVIIECDKGRFYVPIAEIADTGPRLYGIEYAFKNMMPSFK